MPTEPEVRHLTAAGHRLAYLEAGSGDPVLLVHGITTYAFIWRKVVPLLSPHHRVIAVDLLGCGRSDKPLDVDYTLENHARMMVSVLDALGIHRCHVVGHDVGGGVAQILMARHAPRLRTVTLVNTVGYDYWPVQPIVSLRTPIIRQLLMATLDRGSLKLVIRRALHHKERATQELLDLFWQPMREPDGRKAFLHFARCLDNADLLAISGALTRVQLPVLIVRGTGDVYLSSEIAQRLHRDIPDSRLVSIEAAGHFIQEDQPEALAGAVLDFLAQERIPDGR